ncbi:hypothetical protein HMPREF9373_0987 [Psychrobacter sp. 1501(2011)]|nr:hypothetical protein HMPREF9373_0987 [Psychrobacter sp. 1501(2011)]
MLKSGKQGYINKIYLNFGIFNNPDSQKSHPINRMALVAH